MEVETEVSFKI